MALGTKRRAKIELEANTKLLERSLDNAKKRLRQFGTESEKYMAMGTIGLSMPGRAKKAAKAKGGGRGGAFMGGFAGGLASQVGGAALGFLGDAAGDLLAFEKNLVRFQITSGKSTAELAKFRQSILDVSRATGVANADILAGAATYVDLTGDVAGADQAMRTFARVAQASGAQVSDVAQATAALQQSMGLKPDEIEAVFSGMITQGKAGAVSLKDFAGELASLAPQFAKFKGGKGTDAIRDMGAAFQVARQGFGSASEAATGLESFMGSIVQHAKKFEKAGVKIFEKNPKNGKKELRGFHDIVKAIGESRLMKDPTALIDAFGRKEAQQTFDMLNRNLALYDKLADAGKDSGAVARDLATYMASPAGRIEQAFNNVKVAIAEAMTPERIQALATVLTTVLDVLAKIVKHFGDLAGNPLVSKQLGEIEASATLDARVKREMRGAGTTPQSQLAHADKLMAQAGAMSMQDTTTGDERAAIEAKNVAAAQIRQKFPWDSQRAQFDQKRFAAELGAAVAAALRAEPPQVSVDAIKNSPAHRKAAR